MDKFEVFWYRFVYINKYIRSDIKI
jgi:hypothetical protein